MNQHSGRMRNNDEESFQGRSRRIERVIADLIVCCIHIQQVLICSRVFLVTLACIKPLYRYHVTRCGCDPTWAPACTLQVSSRKPLIFLGLPSLLADKEILTHLDLCIRRFGHNSSFFAPTLLCGSRYQETAHMRLTLHTYLWAHHSCRICDGR